MDFISGFDPTPYAPLMPGFLPPLNAPRRTPRPVTRPPVDFSQPTLPAPSLAGLATAPQAPQTPQPVPSTLRPAAESLATPQAPAPHRFAPVGPQLNGVLGQLSQAEDATKAAQASKPQYHGFRKFADILGQIMAPGIETRLGVGTLGYRERVADAEARQAALERQAEGLSQAEQQESTADKNLNPQVAAKEPKFVTDKAGDLIGWQDETGNILSPDDANLPGDIKAIFAAQAQPSAKGAKLLLDQGVPYAIQDQHGNEFVIGDANMPTPLQPMAKAAQAAYEKRQNQTRQPAYKPEIVDQIGDAPDPKNYAGGRSDPKYVADRRAWGKKYEDMLNAEAAASGAAHGAGYQAARPVQVVDDQGNVRWVTAAEAEAHGWAPATDAQKIASREAQFNDIQNASDKVRQAIAEGGNQAFSPTAAAQLRLAMATDNPTAMGTAFTALMAAGLSPAQQDLVTWLYQLEERAMSLRQIAGMGQGSDQVRTAIMRTIPSITSGNTQLAIKQLDAFDNMVQNLSKGVLRAKGTPGMHVGARQPPGNAITDGHGHYKVPSADGKSWVDWEPK